ncbi:MAG: phage holin family protein [Gemmatimonadales bacterium]
MREQPRAQLGEVTMVTLLGRWFVMAGIVAIAAWIAPGFERGGVATVGLTALGIAAVNVSVHPLVASLPFPVPMIALTVVYFVVDVLLLKLAAALVPGFGFTGWGGLAVAALATAIATVAVLAVSGRRRTREV